MPGPRQANGDGFVTTPIIYARRVEAQMPSLLITLPHNVAEIEVSAATAVVVRPQFFF